MARTLVAGPDTFTGSDDTDLTAGGNWTKIRDVTYGSSARIRSNAARGYYATASVSNTTEQAQTVQMVRSAGTYSNDQYSKVTITSFPAENDQRVRAGVIVRASTDTDTNADFYALYVTDETTETTIICKVVNGTFTSLDSRTSVSWANGDTVELEVSGTTLTPYKNGVALGYTVTDSALSTGRPGIYIAGLSGGGDGAGQMITIDDWEGGDVTASANAPRSMHHFRMMRG